MANVLEMLDKEINKIQDDRIRGFTIAAIIAAPDLYWKRASSSTGKHHPIDELGDYGNVYHVKKVSKVVEIFIEAEDLIPIEADTLRSAVLLHDVRKYGDDGAAEKTQDDHPEAVRRYLQNLADMTPYYSNIMDLVDTHMGKWGKYKPETRLQKLCHYADAIASRRWINISIGDDNASR
jgi:hypothetical protein